MHRLFYILAFFGFSPVLSAQHHLTLDKDTCHSVDNIKKWFTDGHFHGHVRNYFMLTQNHGKLKDYYTNASGGALSYQTAYLKGFALGVKGIFSYNTFGNDLISPDETVNKTAKWELELYDVNRPTVKHDLDRLEELYIKYKSKYFKAQIGKIDINKGPLLLRRDGRMKPFVFQGLWTEYQKSKITFNFGLINKVSPRGMTEWFSLNEAIGLNNNGFTYDGNAAHYHEHANTMGLLVASIEQQFSSNFISKIYSYSLHNITQTTWIENEWQKNGWFLGTQLVHQTAMPKQKTLPHELRYKKSNNATLAISFKLEKELKQIHQKISLAYLRVGGEGRFLYPKEMSRENFYVSQPRSWVDGFGDLHVYQIGTEYHFQNQKDISASFFTAYFDTPNSNDFANNKYGVKAYWQNTLSINYHFHQFLEGLEFTLLLINRSSPFDHNLSENQNFYRNNFNHINFIINLNF